MNENSLVKWIRVIVLFFLNLDEKLSKMVIVNLTLYKCRTRLLQTQHVEQQDIRREHAFSSHNAVLA